MEEKIVIDVDTFKQSHKSLGEIVLEVENLKTDINLTVNELCNSWKGKTANLFLEENQKMVQELGDIIGGLKELQIVILNVETDFVELDNLFATEITKTKA